MQLTNPGLTNLKAQAQETAAQPSDWTYWIQKGLQLLGGASPVGGATMALQGAVPQAEPASGASKTTGTSFDVMTVLAGLIPLMLGRRGGKAQQEALELSQKLIKEWGIVPDDMLRLFRGDTRPYTPHAIPGETLETDKALREVQGRWYTPDPGYALMYTDQDTGPLWKVDVPKAQAEDFWIPNQPQEVRQHSPYWTPEYIVSPEAASRAAQVPLPYTSKRPYGTGQRYSEAYREGFGLPEAFELEERIREGPRSWSHRLQREQDAYRQYPEPQAGPDWLQMIRNLYKEMQVLEGP